MSFDPDGYLSEISELADAKIDIAKAAGGV